MELKTVKDLFSSNNWYGILKHFHCTPEEINDNILQHGIKEDLLNLAYAYGQLSNLRKTFNKETHKKEYNLKETRACFDNACTLYDLILKKYPDNTMALQSSAYIYYNMIIGFYGTQNKEIKDMGIDICLCFKKVNELYDRLFSLNIQKPILIKAHYRKGKAYYTIFCKMTHRNIINRIGISVMQGRRVAQHELEICLDMYKQLKSKEEKGAYYACYIKSLYTLGKVYSSFCYDNSMRVSDEYDNILLIRFMDDEKDPIVQKYYTARGSIKYLVVAEKLFLEILDSYKIDSYEPFDMKNFVKQYAKDKTTFPISCRDVWYQLGNLYSKWYRLVSMSIKDKKKCIGRAYSAFYFYTMAIEYCHWCRKLRISTSDYGYIYKRYQMNQMLSGIKNDDKHILHLQDIIHDFIPITKEISIKK